MAPRRRPGPSTRLWATAVVGLVAAVLFFLLFSGALSAPSPTFRTTETLKFRDVTACIVSDESLQALGYEWESLPRESNAAWDIIAAYNAVVPLPPALDGKRPEFPLMYPREGPFADACMKARRFGAWESENVELARWLASNAKPLALLRTAVRKPVFQFPVTAATPDGCWPGLGAGPEFPIQGYILLGDLALLEAARSMAAGDPGRAIDLVNSCLLLAAHLTGNGDQSNDWAYETTAGLVLWNLGLSFLRSTLQSRSFKAVHLQELRGCLADLQPRLPSYAHVLASEKRKSLRALSDAALGYTRSSAKSHGWRGTFPDSNVSSAPVWLAKRRPTVDSSSGPQDVCMRRRN